MKRAALHFFSGTGNTLRAANIIRAKLMDAGYSVDLFRVTSSATVPDRKYDLSIFAFPVYALDIPHIMAGYMKHMPPGEGAKAAIVTSYGNWSPETLPGDAGCCLTRAAGILHKRGYDVLYTDTVGYPVNWTSLLNTPPPENNEPIRKHGDHQAEMIANNIIAGERKVRRGRIFDLASRIFGAVFSLWGRQSIGLMYEADDRCNGCSLCSRSCPASAIKMVKNKPEWNLRCEGCQRCINCCPTTAIQTSLAKLFIVAMLELVSVLTLILLFYLPYNNAAPDLSSGVFMLKGTFYGPLIAFILWFVVFVILLLPLTSWTIKIIELIPGAKRVFKVNITGKNRRYLDPGFRAIETINK